MPQNRMRATVGGAFERLKEQRRKIRGMTKKACSITINMPYIKPNKDGSIHKIKAEALAYDLS